MHSLFLILAVGAGFVVLALLICSLLSASAKREEAWGKAQEEFACRPSAEDVISHVPGLLRERLRDGGVPEDEVLEKVEGVMFFLKEFYLTGVSPWGKYNARALADKMFMVHTDGIFDAFNVLRFEVEYMCHDPEDDTYFLSDELAAAISRRKEQPSHQLQMLPLSSVDTEPRYSC